MEQCSAVAVGRRRKRIRNPAAELGNNDSGDATGHLRPHFGRSYNGPERLVVGKPCVPKTRSPTTGSIP